MKNKKIIFWLLMVMVTAASLFAVYFLIKPSQRSAAVAEKPVEQFYPVYGLLDRVGLYQKNGLVEIYGASLQQQPAGPIRIAGSNLTIEHDQADLFWSPDHPPALEGKIRLLVRFEKRPRHGTMRVGFILGDGTVIDFAYKFGPAKATPSEVGLEPLVPPEFVKALQSEAIHNQLHNQLKPNWKLRLLGKGKLYLMSDLDPSFVEKLNRVKDKGIRTWYLHLTGAAGETLHIDQIVLAKSCPQPADNKISLAGKVVPKQMPPGTPIELLTEDGKLVRQYLSTDGRFHFLDLKPGQPVSIRLNLAGQDYYDTLGRWFVAETDRSDLVVNLRPRYVNVDGHPPDPKKARFITPRKPLKTAAHYESHARQVWPGPGTLPQAYDSITFTNNMGYVDRDRSFEKPEGCLRIVHLGSSHNVALQVRPFEKYNIVMESELGVRLGCAVEVISAGRDNGDIGSHYPKLRDYVAKLNPDIVLFENCKSLIMQLQPELLRRGFGWDHEHSALDSFYYDDQGRLQFRPWEYNYGMFATKPDYPELIPGVQFFDSLSVPMNRMHPLAKEAFRYMGDIVAFYQQKFPHMLFIIHTGLDQAQCGDQCQTRKVKQSDGSELKVGVEIFLKNLQDYCAQRGLHCLNLPIPGKDGQPEVGLVFPNDGHYSVKGNQWLAKELSVGLMDFIQRGIIKVPAPCRGGGASAAREAGRGQQK